MKVYQAIEVLKNWEIAIIPLLTILHLLMSKGNIVSPLNKT